MHVRKFMQLKLCSRILRLLLALFLLTKLWCLPPIVSQKLVTGVILKVHAVIFLF